MQKKMIKVDNSSTYSSFCSANLFTFSVDKIDKWDT
jgi:hypothetical protein